MTTPYAVRLTDAAGQPITDAGTVLVRELLSGAAVATAWIDSKGFTAGLPLSTGVLYQLATASAAIPSAIIMPGKDEIITVTPASATNANGMFGAAQPYELVVPFEILAQFAIVASGAWVGTVTEGGMSGEWLNYNGASWLSAGVLVIPLDASKLKDAAYWHVDVSAIATIAPGAANVPIALQIFSPVPVEYRYDLGGTVVDAATPGNLSVNTRGVLVLDASARAAEIGFRFLAPSDPSLTCSAITGEVTIKPYALQAGQSK